MVEKKITLSMITFFYNESRDILDYLKIVTEKFTLAAAEYDFDFEIILVDDGSTDNSRNIVSDFISSHPHINMKLHSYAQNKGIGHALIQGLNLCGKDYIFWNDIDMHFDISDIEKILPLLNPDTIVVGHKNNLRYKQFFPWLVSRTNYDLLKTIFFWKIKDFQFVQFYPAHYIKNVDIISRSSLIPCELLTRSKQKNLKVIQVPLHYYSPGNGRESKCMNIKNIYFALRDIVKLKLGLMQ
ncbi:MAG: glycosyltransferase [Deltaproteobacteria bacterium]|nr:glycosyltransferase [Deltaproteobacteria bacterium]